MKLDNIQYTNTTKVLNSFSEALIKQYHKNLAQFGISSGLLYNEIKFVISFNGSKFSVSLNLQDYWKYVEHGRKAGSKMPPMDKIEQWISTKNIEPWPSPNGKFPTPKSLAFVIARSIGQKGIKPKPTLEPAVDFIYTEFYDKITTAIQKDILAYIKVEYLDVLINVSKKV